MNDRFSAARLLVLAALWGASFLCIRVAASELSPAATMLVRCSVAAAFLLLIGHRPSPDRGDHGHLLVIGLLNSALPFLLIGWAAKTLPTSLLAVLNATSPVWGALSMAAFTRARPSPQVLLGAGIGVAGVALVTGAALSSLAVEGSGVALACSLGAAASYGLAAAYTKARTVPARSGQQVACGSMIAASAILLVPAAASTSATELMSVSASTWAVLAFLGVAGTGVAYVLYFRLVDDEGPARALVVTLLVPLFATLWSALFLGEPITASTVLGSAVVLIGTYVTTRPVVLPAVRSEVRA